MNYEDRVTKSYIEDALAGCGNCKIAYGSYVGTGQYGAANPNTLTFDFEPKAMFILGTPNPSIALFMRGCARYWNTGIVISSLGTEWSGNTIRWYSTSSNQGAENQMNISGMTYNYVAIG